MVTRRTVMSGLAGGMTAGLIVPGSVGPAWADATATLNERLTGDLAPVHDPCIIAADDLFHVFSTSQLAEGKGLIHWRASPDLLTWTFIGGVMAEFPKWVTDAVPGTKGAWAPDIAYVNGRYRLYYAASTFGTNRSVIGLLTSPTLDNTADDFGWRDEGLVIASDKSNDYNAIDPNYVVDADGRHWLAFGSFWSGLKIVELEPATGKPKAGAEVKALAARGKPDAIEAPFIFRRSDWYYLIASYDFCCRGADSSYYTCIGRSATIDGVYVDRDGRKMSEGGGTLLLHADLDPLKRFKGPGGASVLQSGGKEIIVYHAYDAQRNGMPTLRMQVLAWTADGWPVAV